ncbi:ABC transporter substrate binding protein [Lapidilactobacillus mulanensis]|uniref:ABC transporter substrate binding protein n=1 Tax=Lapidilactobacillus mulanensis TaxID=2485999 RepID=A0ABW4DP38_9LACO|nr:ABC transporter substrate-binding protein [Lapidilactobacillus mulanensis]
MKLSQRIIKGFAIVALAGIAIGLSGCEKKSTATDKDVVKIGILQLMDHESLDAARKGFIYELAKHGYKDGKNLQIDYLNAQGDQSNLKTMSERLQRDNNVVNLAIATPAAQSLKQADTKTPLLFTAITDPVGAGLVKSLKNPGGNVTGTSDLVSVAQQIDLLHQLFPKAKKVGLLYNAAEPNSVYQIKIAKKEIKRLGLTSVSRTVATTNDVEQAMRSLCQESEAIYIPSDNVAASAMATIGKISEEKKVPVVPAVEAMLKLGGVATKALDYNKLGRQTAQMALKIIKDKKKPADIAVERPTDVQLQVNKKFTQIFKISDEKIAKVK